jgi:hypothetical protein
MLRLAPMIPVQTAFVALVILASGQSQNPRDSSADVNRSTLIQKIKSGNVEAIAEAGRSGNKTYIPYLRQQLTNSRDKGTNLSPAAQSRLALAKLGEADQLQDLWCDITYRYPTPLGPLSYVGGWYSVRVLRLFLNAENDPVFERRQRKQDASDLVYPPDSANALKTLTAMFPDGPPGSAEQWLLPAERQRDVQQWNSWIASHTEELKKLQPGDNNVDLSLSACKKGKAKRRR